ncbi:MAG: acyltransferase family protein [Patescibacteria group bacterium]|nr:acyltransferase family protein [Patescibacteria group bacterium]
MQINVPQPFIQTNIFLVIFLISLLFRLKKRFTNLDFSIDLTNQLKGVAILAIIFSHIGYFLSTDSRFLFPISVLAGVGVNLFLLLSGFGLTLSQLTNDYTPIQFYRRRLSKLYLPLWIVLVFLLILDFLLGHFYPLGTILASFAGFFPSNDLYADINSPLWYFTWIIFFYLLYPLVFIKKAPILTAFILTGAGFIVTSFNLPVHESVLQFYKLHLLAFPLGVVLAALIKSHMITKLRSLIHSSTITVFLRVLLLFGLAFVIGYTAIHSGVGGSLMQEEAISLLTTLAIVLFFFLFYFEIYFLRLVGKYSYEIYLFHWPLIYRYDLLYKILPAGITTFIYLIIFVVIGKLLHKGADIFSKVLLRLA